MKRRKPLTLKQQLQQIEKAFKIKKRGLGAHGKRPKITIDEMKELKKQVTRLEQETIMHDGVERLLTIREIAEILGESNIVIGRLSNRSKEERERGARIVQSLKQREIVKKRIKFTPETQKRIKELTKLEIGFGKGREHYTRKLSTKEIAEILKREGTKITPMTIGRFIIQAGIRGHEESKKIERRKSRRIKGEIIRERRAGQRKKRQGCSEEYAAKYKVFYTQPMPKNLTKGDREIVRAVKAITGVSGKAPTAEDIALFLDAEREVSWPVTHQTITRRLRSIFKKYEKAR